MRKRGYVVPMILAATLFLAGCGGKKQETEQVSNDHNYISVDAVNNAVFSIREDDTRDDIVYNPSPLNNNVSPLYYWSGSYTDEAGNIKKYETVMPDYTSPLLISGENRYVYTDTDFIYNCQVNDEITYSISLVHNSNALDQILGSLSISNCSDIMSVPDTFSVTTNDDTHTIRCSSNVTFKNRRGSSFLGTIVIIENDDGQYLYLAGGSDFTTADCKYLADSFDLAESPNDVLDRYEYSTITYDLGGYEISGTFSDIFCIDPGMDLWYDNSTGFKEMYCTNPYVSVISLFGVYYLPVEDSSVDDFMSAFSPFVYEPEYLESRGEITDKDGRVWNRLVYNSSEVTSFDRTVAYVHINGPTVFYIGLIYNQDSTLDFPALMDDSVRSITIKEGVSKVYEESSDFFLNNYGFETEDEEEVKATPTDAAEEKPVKSTPTDAGEGNQEEDSEDGGEDVNDGRIPTDEEAARISDELTNSSDNN